MKVDDVLKDKIKKSLSKPLGTHNENYNIGSNYASVTVSRKGQQYKLIWELTDRAGHLIDKRSEEYDSFDDMWKAMLKLS